MRAAAVQLNSTADKPRNLEIAERLVREAASDGADFVVLPEKWTVLGSGEDLEAGAEPLEGESISAARSWARELGIDLLAGSFAELQETGAGHDGHKLANTSVLIGRDGEIGAVYRKIHMFDVDVGGVAYRESETEEPGEEIVLGEARSDLPDHRSICVGLSVCYDLRFPELYRVLAVRGARIITLPSAFTAETGRDHWEVLLRARAIENQAFVVAANQTGKTPPHYDSYGHSLSADPWGRVLAEVPDGEGFAAADLDLEEQERIRASLPSLANRRPEVYAPEVYA
jgi:predicted amidohydrolase